LQQAGDRTVEVKAPVGNLRVWTMDALAEAQRWGQEHAWRQRVDADLVFVGMLLRCERSALEVTASDGGGPMQCYARHQHLSRVGLLGIGIMILALWGCESGSETSQPMSATTVNIVFPPQTASLLEPSRPETTGAVPRSAPHFFAHLLGGVTRFGSVSVAYAQA